MWAEDNERKNYVKNKPDCKNVTEKTDKDKKTYLSVIKKLRLQ